MALVDGEIRDGLEKSSYQIELYAENLETTLFPDPATQQEFREWYVHKYRDRKPDLIITVGPSPLKFLAQSHEKFFANTPVVFCVSTEEMAGYPKLDSSFTGVWELLEPAKSLDIALKLRPTTRHVVVVGGVAAYDRDIETIIKEGLPHDESRFDVTYLTDLDMPALLDRVKQLPKDSVILYAGISEDAAGRHYIEATQSTPLLTQAANTPIFSVGDVEVILGEGTLGGYLTSFAKEGQIVAADALRILNGEKPRDISIVTGANVYMFDWRALRRWGIKEGSLPTGSIVLNRQPSLWGLYKQYVIAGIVIVVLQALIIVGLLRQRAARRKIRAQLAIEANALAKLNDGSSRLWRMRSLGQGLDEMLTAVIELLGADKGHIQVLDARRQVLTIAAQRGFEQPFLDFFREVSIGHQSACGRALGAGQRVIIEDVETDTTDRTLRAVRQAAGYRAVVSTPLVDSEGGLLGMLTTHFRSPYRPSEQSLRRLDLYAHQAAGFIQRCKMEQALRESEERFSLVANTAPVMIWTAGLDKLCDYVNQRFIEFTGRSVKTELGNGWMDGIHSEELERSWDTYSKAFDQREPFQMEYRLRRHDGEYRWVIGSGVPRFNADGSFIGYIGMVIDVTERKHAEEALITVNQKLIQAHEEERTRIARELHDDINQRLALLAISLEGLQHNLPSSKAKIVQEIAEAGKQVQDLGSDVQAISHHLHSSKLEYLGLVAAAAGFCREVSNRQGVEIDFDSENIPKDLPEDASLCLFRVLQEALQNATKHSGSQHFEVSLRGGSSEIDLTVRDSGIGFDPEEAMKGRGLGLTSIRERLKLVNGNLSIDSRPQHGTTIQARVPLTTGMKSAGAVG